MESASNSFQNTKEKGQIVSIKASYGFIRVLFQESHVFFHMSKVPLHLIESIDTGSNVEFHLEKDPRSHRLSARIIRLLPPGSIVFEELLEDEGRLEAIVTKELSPFRSEREPSGGEVQVISTKETLPFIGRDLIHSSVNLLEGDRVKVSVFIDKFSQTRGATQILLLQPDISKRERGVITSAPNNSYGFIKCAERNEQNLFFHFSERLEEEYIPREGDGVEFNVILDNKGKLCASRVLQIPVEKVSFIKILPTEFVGRVVNSLRHEKVLRSDQVRMIGGSIAFNANLSGREVEELLSFDSTDIVDYEIVNKLLPNDKVQFQMAVFRPTGKRHACNIRLLERAEQIEEKGVVVFVKQRDYGFIERPNSRKNIYFKLHNSCQFSTGDNVSYKVIKSTDGKLYADDLRLLTPGSIRFYQTEETVYHGIIENILKGWSSDVDKSEPIGKIAITEELLKNESLDSSLLKNKNKNKNKSIAFSPNSLSEPRMLLKKGDLVSFGIKRDLRFDDDTELAFDLKLLKPRDGDERDQGVVITLRKDFGFLSSLQHPHGLFFHRMYIVGDKKNSLKCGDEFSFELIIDENDKECAIRLFSLPPNTVILDDIEPFWYIGKIQTIGFEFSPDEGFRGNGKGHLEYCKSDVFNDMVSNLNSDTEFSIQDNKTISSKIFSLPYRSSDLLVDPMTPRRGDFVRFLIAKEKATGNTRATKICILPKVGKVIGITADVGEMEDLFTMERFDFDLLISDRVCVGDVFMFTTELTVKTSECQKRFAVNLKRSQFASIDNGFFKGYVREIISVEHK